MYSNFIIIVINFTTKTFKVLLNIYFHLLRQINPAVAVSPQTGTYRNDKNDGDIVAVGGDCGTCGNGVGPANAAQPFMRQAGRTTQPVGHYEFCRASRRMQVEVCQAETGRTDAGLVDSDGRHQQNGQHDGHARTDMEIWGQEEKWSYPDGAGDCEDYALEKRRQLMQLGVSAGDLLITVVRQPNGDGHAVLTMRTSHGEFVLDNLEPRILMWTDTEYTFLKRQSERNSGIWVQINDGRADAVASVR